jgi:hypothetical protein
MARGLPVEAASALLLVSLSDEFSDTCVELPKTLVLVERIRIRPTYRISDRRIRLVQVIEGLLARSHTHATYGAGAGVAGNHEHPLSASDSGTGTITTMTRLLDPVAAALESALAQATADGAEISGTSAVRLVRDALNVFVGVGDPVAVAVMASLSRLELDGAYGANAVGVAITARSAFAEVTEIDQSAFPAF